MTNEEIEREWQKELKSFLNYHSEKIKGMSQEEERKYIMDNKVNEKLQQLQKNFKKNMVKHM